MLSELKNAKNLHHAYAIEGEREPVSDEIRNFIEKRFEINTKANQDFMYERYDVLGVDEARIIKEQALRKPAQGKHKFFIIALHSITREAENSLLKLFEEPTPDTYFFVILPNVERLSSTLKSRMQVVYADAKGKQKSDIDPQAFLSSSYNKRLATVKTLVDAISDEKKTKADALIFLDLLEESWFKEIQKRKKTIEDVRVGEEIMKGRSFLEDRSASVKLILEHIALTIPVLK